MEKQYSVACLIVGILSCVLCCMCVGFPLGIAGVVLFVLSTRNGNEADAKAIIGLILSIIGFILSIIHLIQTEITIIMTVYLTTLIMIMIRLIMTIITKTYLTNMTTVFLTTTKVTDLKNFKI